MLASPRPAGQHPPALPDLHPGRLRLGELRRGARTAAPGRAQPAARGADDDPGGVGERPGHGRRRSGALLPLPRQPDGAVGRPGRGRVHRRRRSSARCSTATACARGAGGAPPTGWWCWAARPACSTWTRPRSSRRAGCSRAGCSWSTPPPGGSSTTTRSRTSWPPTQPYADWLHAGLIELDDLPDAGAHRLQPRVGTPPPADLRLHRGGAEDPARADGADRGRTDRLDGHRHADRAAVAPGRGCSTTTSTNSSPRSPTRRWTPSGRSWSPACRRPSARRATCWTRAGQLPADRAAVPGHRQRRAGEDPVHRRGRGPARVQGGPGLRALPGARRRGWASRPA